MGLQADELQVRVGTKESLIFALRPEYGKEYERADDSTHAAEVIT